MKMNKTIGFILILITVAALAISPLMLKPALAISPLMLKPALAVDTQSRAGSFPTFEEFDGYIEANLKKLNAPGAALVIVEGERIIHTAGFGSTGPQGGTPTDETPFFIGSLTKSFTALAVMQLAETGRIDLDAPVQRYLPWFTLADAGAAARITVRHLLNQTSGIPQIPGMLNLANFDAAPGAAEEQAVALASVKPLYPAGSTFEYSNINYNLLGLVVEAASGETYAGYIREHIFTPLNMQRSHTSKAAARQDGLAVGHRQWFGFPAPVPEMPVPQGSLASGQLIASAGDLGRYLSAQLNGGSYQGVSILSPEGIAEMHRPAATIELAGKDMGDYGMGWFVIEREEEPIIFHYGEVPDYFAYMALIPGQNRAFALLVNTNHHLYNYALWALAENAAFWLAGLPPQSNAWGILPWAMPALILLPLGQAAGGVVFFRRVKRWQSEPTSRPAPARLWVRHLILPGILDLALIAAATGVLFSGMFGFLMLFLGDMMVIMLACGLVAFVLLIMRTMFVLKFNRTG
jgi:CubicO group peptidase (beta-lactamase class C family)